MAQHTHTNLQGTHTRAHTAHTHTVHTHTNLQGARTHAHTAHAHTAHTHTAHTHTNLQELRWRQVLGMQHQSSFLTPHELWVFGRQALQRCRARGESARPALGRSGGGSKHCQLLR